MCLTDRRIEAEHLGRQFVGVVLDRQCRIDRLIGGGLNGRRGFWQSLLRRREELVGNAIVLRDSAAPDLDPDVIAAARGHDGEMLARELRHRRQFVLHGAELIEHVRQFRRQQLRHHPIDGFERKAAAREVDLFSRRHDVRLVAGVHHQRFAVNSDDRLKQSGNKTHLLTLARTGTPRHRRSTK